MLSAASSSVCVMGLFVECVYISDRGPILEQQFFDFEIKMEGDICRDLVSMSPQDERRKFVQALKWLQLFSLCPTFCFYPTFPFFLKKRLLSPLLVTQALARPDKHSQVFIYFPDVRFLSIY